MSHLYKFLSFVLLGIFTALRALRKLFENADWYLWYKAHDLFDNYRVSRNRELRDQLTAAAHQYGEQIKDIDARRRALDAVMQRTALDYEAKAIDIAKALEQLKEEVL